MHWNLDFADFLLGDRVHSEEVLIRQPKLKIPMPEGTYDASAKLTRGTWKRPRWPFPLVVMRVSIDIPDGIPIPGKGENSWDCGPDATYGTTGPASSIEEAVGDLVARTLETRKRRGGSADYSKRRAS
jgi:hypothetical protein